MGPPAHPSDPRFTLNDAMRALVLVGEFTPVGRMASKTVGVSSYYFPDDNGKSVGPFVTEDAYQAIRKLLAKP